LGTLVGVFLVTFALYTVPSLIIKKMHEPTVQTEQTAQSTKAETNSTNEK
jgi:hypothetical protein